MHLDECDVYRKTFNILSQSFRYIVLHIFNISRYFGSTQPPIQWVPGVKRQLHEADHPPPTSAEAKACIHTCSLYMYTNACLIFLFLQVSSHTLEFVSIALPFI
jgi:hypothetical protein